MRVCLMLDVFLDDCESHMYINEYCMIYCMYSAVITYVVVAVGVGCRLDTDRQSSKDTDRQSSKDRQSQREREREIPNSMLQCCQFIEIDRDRRDEHKQE